VSRDGDDEALDLKYWSDYRAALLSQVDAVERHRLKMTLTTADIRRWVEKHGPKEPIMVQQVRHIKEGNR